MKKTYIAPQATSLACISQGMLAVSATLSATEKGGSASLSNHLSDEEDWED